MRFELGNATVRDEVDTHDVTSPKITHEPVNRSCRTEGVGTL